MLTKLLQHWLVRGILQYLWNILYSLDQLLNVILGGDPDECYSSRLGKVVRDRLRKGLPKYGGYGGWFAKLLDRVEEDHCIKSIEDDEGSREIKWRDKDK